VKGRLFKSGLKKKVKQKVLITLGFSLLKNISIHYSTLTIESKKIR